MTRFPETDFKPPASGVMVKAALFPIGFRTVRIEFATVVVTNDIPTI